MAGGGGGGKGKESLSIKPSDDEAIYHLEEEKGGEAVGAQKFPPSFALWAKKYMS